MKLQQLRYAVETFRRNLNVSEAAEALFTSQPGVSKQIKLLEEEIGVQIFVRNGKRMVAVTQPGMEVLTIAERILHDVKKIKNIGSEFSDASGGMLTVAASYTLARYVLPELVAEFMRDYPKVRLHIQQGSPDEIAAMVEKGEADFALTSEMPREMPQLKRLMCGVWRYALLLPKNHILAQKENITLEDLSSYPLITYNYATLPYSIVGRAFARKRVQSYISFASGDNDVLKTYVRLGLGIGLLDWEACVSESETVDGDLWVHDVSHWFEPSYMQILVRTDVLLRKYIYDFIRRIDSNLNKERVDALLYAPPLDDFSI